MIIEIQETKPAEITVPEIQHTAASLLKELEDGTLTVERLKWTRDQYKALFISYEVAIGIVNQAEPKAQVDTEINKLILSATT